MMRRLARLHKDSQGFTLVELMIVVAIIGILAAIAVPQFAAYRTRSFNANAKAMNKQAVNSQSDLNAELGCYGHTMAAAGTLVAADGAVAAAVSSTTPAVGVGATAATAGGRIVGLNVTSGKTFSVPLGIGNNMALITWGTVATAAGGVCDGGGCSNVVVARADKGDTAYGSDSDSANTLYSVSNPNWASGAAGIVATVPALANDGCNDFTTVACAAAPVPGAGSPTATWAQVQ